ncbi:MAG TPA: xanthine dehydrogenase family protein molybdopterin-binding subunit [Acidimicrobiales bacterium]|nr:xanthine dehydrogenase family protein molybdopterin-binding subunit [Acidimicrobiales bacterium]
MQRFTGARVKRVEDARLLTGRGQFVDDIDLPGTLHLVIVRSTVGHARLVSVDVDAARSMPGVVAAYAGSDLVDHMDPLALAPVDGLICPPFYPLATDKVRFVGEPVAAVVAESRYLAEDAAEQVVVDYDPLPAVVDPEEAVTPGSPLLFEELGTNVMFNKEERYGDTDAAFARADRVITEKFVQHRYANVPMEGHACVSSFDPAKGELTHWSSCPGVHTFRLGLAFTLRLPATKVRVLIGDIGGAFGSKGYMQREEVTAAFATMRLGRPVKWVADRTENMLAGGQSREETVEVDAAVTADGRLLGLRVRLLQNQGAYACVPFPPIVFPLLARAFMPSAYRISDFDFEITVACTNKAQYVAYRGPWEIETWVRERLFDVIPKELGLDPVEFRRMNLWDDSELPRPLATGAAILKDLTVRECLDTATAALDYPAFRSQQAALREDGRYLGVGFSCFMEPAPQPVFGIGFDFVRSETASAQLEPDGSVTVFSSQGPHGQGLQTTIAQVCADRIGLPMERVNVLVGDTQITAFSNIGTGASRGSTMATGSALGALQIVMDRVVGIARALLGAGDDEDLTFVDGMVLRPSGAGISLTEVALAAYTDVNLPKHLDTHMKATYTFDYPGAWSQSCHCCVVEVDAGTGKVEILRYIIAENCGKPIHPAIVDGQIAGGVTQGIGASLYEHSAYDADGQYLAASFMDYLVPTVMEVPAYEIHHIIPDNDEEIPWRGVGEGGLIGSPAAVTNAVEDALAPFGAKVRESYLPPARVLELAGVIEPEAVG